MENIIQGVSNALIKNNNKFAVNTDRENIFNTTQDEAQRFVFGLHNPSISSFLSYQKLNEGVYFTPDFLPAMCLLAFCMSTACLKNLGIRNYHLSKNNTKLNINIIFTYWIL